MRHELSRRDWLAAAALPWWAGIGAAADPARTPSSACTGSAALCPMLDAAGRDGSNTHAVLAERGGKLLAEAYFTARDKPSGAWFEREVAFDRDTPHDLRSITKSVVGLLAGIAQGRGELGTLDRPVLDFFPEYADLATPERRAITVGHLLDMTPGWQWDEWTQPYGTLANSETHWVLAADRHRHMFELPQQHPPGTRFEYCGGATALLGEILERVAGQPLPQQAEQRLFAPLGIAPPTWRTSWRGKAMADSGLRLTPRDMARIGRLMLGGGRWQGQAVVPADWVAASMTPRIRAADGYAYSRQWWQGPFVRGRGAGVAWTAGFGNGGQRLFIVPSLDLVVVVTAGRYNQPGSGRASNLLFGTLLELVTAAPA